MNWKLSFICLALWAMAGVVQAQDLKPVAVAARGNNFTNLVPPIPRTHSPVTFFRQLLAMSPMERNHALTNRPPENRTLIMAKIREYQALDADERELRLRATELRWWLTPLFHAAPTNREARLAMVPEELRDIVKARLAQWDLLPPPLQKELLANDQTLRYFANVTMTNAPAASPEQQKIAGQFNRFFELTPKEKQQALNTLSAAERAAMEKTLKSFDQLPAQQRLQCIRNYAKFAGMTAAERADFLKNAEKWSQMSPKERQSWRDLVTRVPMMPPLPQPPIPANIFPHPVVKTPRPSVATN
jgi:hypothetical protein